MIEITRLLARQLRAVFRKLVPRPVPGQPPVVFRAGEDGLRVRLQHAEVAAEFHQAGAAAETTLALHLADLADFEGGRSAAVLLEASGSGRVTARWEDGGVPQLKEYDAPDVQNLPPFPDHPKQMLTNEPGLLQALHEAGRSAARAGVRYALDHLQLRGGAGQVVATDGRQLLLQSGFHFPWAEAVLIPATPAFGCRELPADVPVAVGKSDGHVTLQAGPWTLHLPIAKEGRYPPYEPVIPSVKRAVSRWRVAPADAAFLARALPRLPGSGDDHAPVTVDLNGQAVIRARAEGQGRSTELLLSRSEVVGSPVRLQVNRDLLGRAVRLGFAEILIVNADTPLLCRDDRRTFVIMPLGKDHALPPDRDALRITSAEEPPSSSSPPTQRRTDPMPVPSPNGRSSEPERPPDPTDRGGINDLITEAETLRTMLGDAAARTARLLAALKQQRRQDRAVRAAMASLRQLQLDR